MSSIKELHIKFRGIDDWNRPVFKVVDKPIYIGSVVSLFDYTDSKEKIISYFKEHISELVIFGTHFCCEPNGDYINKNTKIIIDE